MKLMKMTLIVLCALTVTGFANVQEYKFPAYKRVFQSTVHDYFGNPRIIMDFDQDRICDFWEGQYNRDGKITDWEADPDGDGMSNYVEMANGFNPFKWTKVPRILTAAEQAEAERKYAIDRALALEANKLKWAARKAELGQFMPLVLGTQEEHDEADKEAMKAMLERAQQSDREKYPNGPPRLYSFDQSKMQVERMDATFNLPDGQSAAEQSAGKDGQVARKL
jgi:hypothetical protein